MITLDPNDQEEGFDRFVHVDEVAAVAAERDAYRDALEAIRNHLGIPSEVDHLGLVNVALARLTAAEDALRDIAVALGQPDQDLADLLESVKALRLQRDRLQAAAQDALAIGSRP